jgi:NAD(P)H-hydrate epimerase
MATGGTGDVLAGVIASLIAQRHNDPRPDLFALTQAGVQAHARAGEAWAAEHHASGGMTPTDLADRIPPQIEALRA